MNRIFEKTLLFDFYGELLTEHQRNVYSDVVFDDMSLSEAAETYGISRQGVHDMLKRCDRTLNEYEEKLHLISQFEEIRKTVRGMKELLEKKEQLSDAERTELIHMTDRILNEL